MKKILAFALCAMMILTSVAALAEGESIVWAGWSGEEEASKDIFQKMMDTYTESTGNDVTWVGWTWADTAQQLLIRLQGGEQLDIAQADISIFNTIAQTGTLADWTEVLGADFLAENFEEAALAAGQVDGKQLGLPWSMASISMVYNPAMLKEAGWDAAPATIEEFEACMADIKAMDENIIPYAISTKDTTCAGDLMPWLWTFGGSIYAEDGSVAINSQATIDCLNWYKSMMDKGYIAMDMGRGDSRQLFAQSKIAFYDDAVIAKGQAVNNGVDPDEVVNVCSAMLRPVLAAGDMPQSTMWGHMLVTFNASEHKEAAGEMAKVLVGDEIAMEYFQNNGMPPVTKSAAASEAVVSDAYLSGFMASTATARLEETASMVNANEVKNILTEEIQGVLLGQKTAEEAASSMESRLNSL